MHRVGAFVVAAAVMLLAPSTLPAASQVTFLDQGWTAKDRTAWYEASQGSRLIPFAWLKALEQPGDGGGLILDDAFVARYRYLPATTSFGERLPVGFVLDTTDEAQLTRTDLRWRTGQDGREPWVGMTCSACHTAEISYGQHTLRVDGGPTLADFQSFIEAIDLSVLQTREDPARFDRFARRVLAADDTPANRAQLQAALSQLLIQRQASNDLNATTMRYGYGRLDAIGRIFNQLALHLKSDLPLQNAPDAPVSYPFLWNVPQHERVEWNGLTPNIVIPSPIGDPFDVGALARNTGEVIGVFGDLDLTQHAGAAGYRSSVNISNLAALEQLLRSLKPPPWPAEVFGAPDPTLVSAGEALFKGRCASCHQMLRRDDLKTRIDLRMSLFRASDTFSPPGTDIWMACNAYTYKAKSGVLEGMPTGYISGPPIGAEAAATSLLEVAVKGAMLGKKWDIAKTAAQNFFGVARPPTITRPRRGGFAIEAEPGREQTAQTCMKAENAYLGYKIRPLTGIWATAPYLHNGSVPTLYDLLLPEDRRPAEFHVGSREFDPVKVGFRTAPDGEESFLFRTRDEEGRSLPGNSNLGHDYDNASLSEADRQALIAYLKTL